MSIMRENRRRIPAGPMRVRIAHRSGNRKTGPIPVTASSAGTCPTSCSWYGAGCYAEVGHWSRLHWSKVPEDGLTWKSFVSQVAAFPEGQLWRHNEAGDLPGSGDRVDVQKLLMLVVANLGKRGFTYTHKPLDQEHEAVAIRHANTRGFTVNLSADSPEHADRLADRDIGPVTMVVPRSHPRLSRTPKGRPVVVCPNETHGITCERCRLCAVPKRRTIVAFRAHGPAASTVEKQLVQLRLPGLEQKSA